MKTNTGNYLEDRRGQFDPVQSESLVPLVRLERHKPYLHSHHDKDNDEDDEDDDYDSDDDDDDDDADGSDE